jgi:hypothetical protein
MYMNNARIYDWCKTDTSFMNVYKDPDAAVYNTIEYHTGPENKREIPCDSCELADKCAAKNLECSAFRTWAHRGDYVDSDVARLLREGK